MADGEVDGVNRRRPTNNDDDDTVPFAACCFLPACWCRICRNRCCAADAPAWSNSPCDCRTRKFENGGLLFSDRDLEAQFLMMKRRRVTLCILCAVLVASLVASSFAFVYAMPQIGFHDNDGLTGGGVVAAFFVCAVGSPFVALGLFARSFTNRGRRWAYQLAPTHPG